MKLIEVVAQNIRARREALKLSQLQFAHSVGISPSYVNLLENGHRSPTLEMVERLAKGLGVDVPKLLTPAKGKS